MARAAVRKARMRNGFSPLSSRKAAIWSSTSATAFLSMKSLGSPSGRSDGGRREPGGAPAQLEQLFLTGDGVESRGLAAGKGGSEEGAAVGAGRLPGRAPLTSTALNPARSGRSPKTPSTRRSASGTRLTKQPSSGSAGSPSTTLAHTRRSGSWA